VFNKVSLNFIKANSMNQSPTLKSWHSFS